MSHVFTVRVSQFTFIWAHRKYGFSCAHFEGANESWTVLYDLVFYRVSSTCEKYG